MKTFKKIICSILALAVMMSVLCVPSLAAGDIAYGAGKVDASVLNIRSGTGTNYPVIATVNDGSSVVILEKTTSSWYKINYNGTVGYVSSQYLEDVTTVENLSLEGKVNNSYVRYRTGPSTSNDIVGTLNTGAKVQVIGINRGWYKISYNSTTGYMRSDYIDIIGAAGGTVATPDEPETPNEPETPDNNDTDNSQPDTAVPVNKKGTVTDDYVNFRSAPALSSTVYRTLNRGTSVEILEELTGWYKITHNGTTGYMSSDYIKPVEEDAEEPEEEQPKPEEPEEPEVEAMDEVGYVSGSAVRMRTGPSTSYSIITTLSRGTSVKITGKSNGWYRIEYNGKTGFMSGDYVKIGELSTSEGTELGREIAEYVQRFVGYTYVYGGASPSTGFDCSGLMYYVYGQFGYSIQRGAGSQYAKSGRYISKSELQPGDLVFFSSNGFVSVTHVGMYIGDNKFVHASGTGVGVIVSDLTTSYYTRVYYGAKRII